MIFKPSVKISLFFLLLAGFLFFPMLSGKVVMANWDRPMMGLPSHFFASQMIKKGFFPLWNPLLLSGYNYCGSGQFHLFNPLDFLAYLFPQTWLLHILAFSAYIKFAFSGIFTYLFVERLIKSRFWGVLAGIMYMFSGSSIAMLTLVDMGAHHPMFLFPLLLFLAILLCEKGRLVTWIFFSIAVAFMFLGGMLHLCIFSLAITIVFFAWHSFFLLQQENFAMRLRFTLERLAVLGSAIAVGILLASIRLAPFFYAMSLSARLRITSEAELMKWIMETAVPVIGTLRMIMPEFFGSKLNSSFMGGNMGLHLNHIETFPHYVGIAGLALSFLGILRCNKKTLVWTLFILGMLMFTINSPLSLFIQRYILKGRMVLMCRFSLMLPMCLAVLAGYGGRWLEEESGHPLNLLHFIFIPATFLIAVFSFFTYPHRLNLKILNQDVSLQFISVIYLAVVLFLILAVSLYYRFSNMPKNIFFGLLGAILFFDILAIAYVESNNSQNFMGYAPLYLEKAQLSDIGGTEEFEDTPPYEYRVYMGGGRIDFKGNSVYPFSLSTIVGLHDVTGGEAFCHKRYAEFVTFPRQPYFRGVYGLLPTPRLVTLLGIKNNGYPTLPRVGLYDKYIVVKKDEVLRELFAEGFDPLRVVILEDEPGIGSYEGEDRDRGSARIVDYQPNSVEVETQANVKSILLLTDRHEEGWRATIDGNKAKIYFADYIYRAVVVPPGRHLVRFSYFPPSLGKGMALSGIGIMILVIISVLVLWKRKK